MSCRSLARRGFIGLVAVAALALPSCSDGEPEGPTGVSSTADRRDQADGAPGGAAPGPATDRMSPAERGADGSRTITAEDGTPAIILPPVPDRTRVRASRGCEGDGGDPAPSSLGLRAARADGAVLVTYALPESTSRCEPYRVRLTLYVSGTGLSQTFTYPIRADGRQLVPVPEHFDLAPDVVRASAITRRGSRSEVVSVRIPEDASGRR